MSTKRALLLIDHGSRRAEANELIANLASEVQKREPELIIKVAHLELAEPSIEEGYRACIDAGASHVTILPCMLTLGRHVAEDIPRIIAKVSSATPQINYAIAEPLGTQPLLIDVILAQFARANA